MPPSIIDREQQVFGEGRRDTSLKANWRIFAITLYLGTSLFEYGFDKGAIAGFQAMPGFLQVFGYQTLDGNWAIHSGPQQIISSFMVLGNMIGSASTGFIGSYIGRRYALMLGSLLVIVSTVIMSETTSMGALYFSRLLIGIGNGILLNFTVLYLQECTPAYFRGLCMSMVTCWIVIGTTIGMVVNNKTASIMSRQAYQIPLYICYPAPVILILTLPFFPETPRWLLHRGKPDEAFRSLQFFRRGTYDEVALREEFEEMKAAARRQREVQTSWITFFKLFRGPNLRRTMVAVGVGTTNAAIGAMFVLAFGTYFFEVAEVSDPFQWIIVTNCIGIAGLLLTWAVVTRVGRRQIILVGCALCTTTMLIMASVFAAPNVDKASKDIALIVTVSVYIFGFNFGVEPYVYLVAGEIPSQQLRGYTLGFSTTVSFFFGWLTAFTTPYFINPTELNWGPKYGYVWFGSGLITTAFIWYCLPEVRGRTLEEIDEMFRNNVPTREFSKYVCIENLEAQERGRKEVKAEDNPTEAHVEVVQ
ncbi:sugar porter (SP) family MFS transporter [Penicillium robsamsonii]|uniref:sugar porter (SP) family MFS transporter n=1 Tax=Penicillium robsamsonii TaxID=1792511 RepID=UPI00254896D7|nr:sugar porter (SP) family MFS transporter [Penicillium robsamsonii]KAJ5827168.1 sugar porter (SP) family MFS transporter [Penicillium robsamsonii]